MTRTVTRTTTSLLAALAIFGLAGCTNLNHQQQSMLSGGAIGAGAGAVVSVLADGNPVIGALVGAGAGTAAGAILGR